MLWWASRFRDVHSGDVNLKHTRQSVISVLLCISMLSLVLYLCQIILTICIDITISFTLNYLLKINLFVYSYSRRSGQYTMNHENSKKSTERPQFDRSSSQDSVDELSMDDYWKELENIHETSENNHKEQEVVVVKEPDGNILMNDYFSGH